MRRLVAIAAAGLLLGACSTGWRLDERRVAALQAVQTGEYHRAAAGFNRLYDSHLAGEPAAPGDAPEGDTDISVKHGLLWRLERGLLALHADRTEAARGHLSDAIERAEALLAADLAAGVASAVANDTVRDYVGSAYEREAAAYFLGLAESIDAHRLADRYAGDARGEASVTALDRFDRAVNALRNLVLVQTPLTEGTAGDRRYRGSGFFHLAAAAMVLAHPQPLDSDLDFADEMLRRAERRYRAEHAAYAGDDDLHYEVPRVPRLVEALRWRLLARRPEPQRSRMLAELDTELATLRSEGLIPPRDHGSVLVLLHRGFVTRPQPLDIRLISSDLGSLGRHHRRRDRFRVGFLVFGVRGPGAWQVADWGVIPFPGELTGELAPGGLAVMGFSIPAHAPDRPIEPAPVLAGRAIAASWDASARGETVGDLDAWARGELEDRQVQVMLKTLVRTVLKQLAAGTVAHHAREQQGDLAGLLVNLLTSSLATASEQADIRAVTMLPDHVDALLLDLPAGEHALSLRQGRLEQPLGRIRVAPAATVILPVFEPTAGPPLVAPRE